METGNFMQDMSSQERSLSSDCFPKITLKQAEKAVKKNSFKISRPQYSKKRVKKADKFEHKHNFRYEDVWNLDHSIACFILPRLVYLRDIQHGYPAYFSLNYPTEEEAVAEWTKILNEMIYGFYIYVTKDEIFWEDEDKIAWDRAKSWLCRYFSSLWD